VAGRCNASQDAQDAWDAGDASLASGRNADGSDAGSVFADARVKADPVTADQGQGSWVLGVDLEDIIF